MGLQVVRRKKVDSGPERQLLIGMVTSEGFLAELEPIFQPDYLQSDYARTVAGWCLDYYSKFRTAPGVHIQDLYESNKRNGLDEDTAELIGRFLSSISEEFERSEKFSVDFMMGEVEKMFKTRAMSMLAEDVQAFLSQGNTQDAELTLSQFVVPERKGGDWVDPFTDEELISKAFQEDGHSVLFKMPGALGELLGPIERDSLISFMGPEKRGKTWWMIEFAMRALRARCNVAFFEIGDMTKKQMQKRLYSYLCQASPRYAGREIMKPVLDCRKNQTGSCERPEWLNQSMIVGSYPKDAKGAYHVGSLEDYPDHVPCSACIRRAPDAFQGSYWWQYMTVPDLAEVPTLAKAKEFMSRVGTARFRMSCQPSDTVSAEWVEKQTELWFRRDGFIPDLIVVDYADNLAHIMSKKEERHAINQTWQRLRRISQVMNCCVMTATQAGRSAYGKASVKAQDTSEDKRKLAHVNAMIALNQTDEEKAAGIMRLSSILTREDAYDARRNVTVLQCLSIGRPYLASYF